MIGLRQAMAEQFRAQEAFADGYAPLTARLFGTVASWLEAAGPDPVVNWLLSAGAQREPFDVTLLLLAALHRDVLAGVPETAALAAYYPTSGGCVPEGSDPAFEDALRAAILGRRDALAPVIATATVQTNETARGLAWLLPAGLMGWPAIHVVELGASAGLNLAAEQRAYRLVPADDPDEVLLELGARRPGPFVTRVANPIAEMPRSVTLPRILSRTGGDVAPFRLATPADELALASFVWGDQPLRLERLREGIAALKALEATAAPVRLFPVNLPHGLPDFLDRHVPREPQAPVLLYNTVVTMYLEDGGAALARYVAQWAARRPAPVLWVQWEPPRPGEGEPPEAAWSAWTVDLWADGAHERWRLAWVHPHGTRLEWRPGFADFLGRTMHS